MLVPIDETNRCIWPNIRTVFCIFPFGEFCEANGQHTVDRPLSEGNTVRLYCPTPIFLSNLCDSEKFCFLCKLHQLRRMRTHRWLKVAVTDRKYSSRKRGETRLIDLARFTSRSGTRNIKIKALRITRSTLYTVYFSQEWAVRAQHKEHIPSDTYGDFFRWQKSNPGIDSSLIHLTS